MSVSESHYYGLQKFFLLAKTDSLRAELLTNASKSTLRLARDWPNSVHVIWCILKIEIERLNEQSSGPKVAFKI